MPKKKVLCSNCGDECEKEKSVEGIIYYRCLPCARIEKAEGGPKAPEQE